MARIIVTADHATQHDAPVLLDEGVHSVHLSTDHAARQLVERLIWALADAEDVERAQSARDIPRRSGDRTDASRSRRVPAVPAAV